MTAATSFNGYYQKWHFRERCGTTCSSEAVQSGIARCPFVFRQLLLFVANTISGLVPENVRYRLVSGDVADFSYGRQTIGSSPGAESKWVLTYWIVYVMDFVSAWLAGTTLFECGNALGLAAPASALASGILILRVPFFMSVGGYYYDYPEVFFCALSFWVAMKLDGWWALGTKRHSLYLSLCSILSWACAIPDAERW